MKKLLSILLLLSSQIAFINADEPSKVSVLPEHPGVIQVVEKIVEHNKDESVEDEQNESLRSTQSLADFLEKMEKTEVEITPQLAEQWLKWKADKLALSAVEMRYLAQQIEDSEVRHKFQHMAEKLFKLSDEFDELQVPDQKIRKSFKHIEEWIGIEARKLRLASNTWKMVAEQTDNEYAEQLAEHESEIAENLETALELA